MPGLAHNSTVSKSEPAWGGVSKTKLPRSAFARKGEPGKKSTWGFPHHWVKGGSTTDDDGIWTDGTMYLHRGGLNAAWSAANGGRSGKKAEPAVLAHVRKHLSDLGIKKSDLIALDPDVDVAVLDAELLAAGLLTAAELAGPEPATLLSRLLAESGVGE